jgi:transglutaminase-like putative cysteine protease
VYLERLLQINTATLAALATLLVGMGERSPWLPLGMAVAAFASVWVTDVAGWFRLNRPITTVAALVAVILALWQVVGLRNPTQVFAIGNLLVYLQGILLFQQKDLRTYWQLLSLSLLEVVIAAAFNQGALFGVLLIVYLAAGLSAMGLAFLHGERTRYAPTGDEPTAEPAPARRWALAGQTPSFASSQGSSPGRLAMGGELWSRLAKIALGTLALAMAFFLIMPRLGHSAWRGPGGAMLRSVGFSDKVKLGELGKAIENRQEVLRIRFLDDAGQPYIVQGELHLRGVVLTDYTRGQWQSYEHPGGERYHAVKRGTLLPNERLVRQAITIEPMDRQELFCVWPYLGTKDEPDRRLLFDVQRQRLLRAGEYAGKQFTYELDTTAFVNHMQANLVPNEGRLRRQALLNMPPTDTLPGLVAFAADELRKTSLGPDDRVNRARHLERMLRDSGRFAYSLEGQPRDRSLDPIEDFVTKHRQGHCEYFASALVLMLRSQQIPARLVAGFKTDEWNPLGGFFQVRQLHAHTWVEVYLEPRHLPSELIQGDRHWEWADGAWLRLDPTPAADVPVSAGQTLLKKMDRYLTWLDHLWDTYVVSMDRSRQREAIYRPMLATVERIAQRLTDPAWWRDLLATAGLWFRDYVARLGAWRWLWAAVIGVLGLAGALVVSSWLGLAPQRLLHRLTGRVTGDRKGMRSRVEFYHRLETVLARHGLTRPPQQTPREFAQEAGTMLAQTTGEDELAAIPSQIAEAFYRVRFGEVVLDGTQAAAIEALLAQLEHASEAALKLASPLPLG